MRGSRTILRTDYCSHDLLIVDTFKLLGKILFPSDRQTEIDQFDVIGIFSQEQKVLGLQISMSNFAQMKIVNSLDHLSEEYSGIFFAQTALLIEPVEELASFAETELSDGYS